MQFWTALENPAILNRQKNNFGLRMKKNWKILSSRKNLAVIFLIAGFLFFSCSQNSKQSSFLSALDTVDSFIQLGQTDDALKLLKKTSKSAYSAYARIGIYRRFMTLGEKSLAEKILSDSLKKIPGNIEISAVYSHFLLREGRFDEALKIGSVLEGSKYGSIYAEAVLKSQKEKNLLLPQFSRIYGACYSSTGNEKWLVNAALPFVKNGNYSAAAALQKSVQSDFNLFWAQVQFDAKNYDLCVENYENAQSKGFSSENFELTDLASDAFFMLGDYDSAEKERERLIFQAKTEKNADIPELIYVNSALWAYNAAQYSKAYDLLMTVIMRDSKNIPALITYGKFARADSVLEKQDLFERELRKTSLRTYSMRQKDERPKFLIRDAIFRIEQMLEWQKKNAQALSDELLVEKLSLWLAENSSLPQKKVESEIWKNLEINEIEKNMYPPALLHFAVNEFLNFGKKEDARLLFEKYLDARYKMKKTDVQDEKVEYDIFGGEKTYSAPPVPEFVTRAAFGDRAADYANTMETWEIETAAYFALLDNNISAARRLYEYALFETGGARTVEADGQIVSFSRLCAVNSAVNLAVIYASVGELKRALNLYGLASGRTKDKKLKSKILYRTALVQSDLQNKEGAILSLEYALSLNPMNADARLMLRKLK